MDTGATAALISVLKLFKFDNIEKMISQAVELSDGSVPSFPVSLKTCFGGGKLKNKVGVDAIVFTAVPAKTIRACVQAL